MKKIKIALIGQPNVGKSQLINSISNSNLKVGNFSHTTVEKVAVTFKYNDYDIELIDLPGTYSLKNKTEDEMITNDFLLNEEYDIIVNVCNSTEIRKNINLTNELVELKRKTIIVLNMSDEAQKLGLKIDTNLFSSISGTDVLSISALKKDNIDNLLKTILKVYENNIVKELKHVTTNDITIKLGIKSKPPIYKIDNYLLHPIMGIIIFLLVIWGVFELSFTLGNQLIVSYLQEGLGLLQDYLRTVISYKPVASLIVDGIIGGVGSVIVFLPDIIILFFCLAVLEGSGYINRATFMLDGFFRKLGVDGGSFIPLISGFGCSIPAYMATRSLKNRRNKIITMFAVAFMSCSARLPIYVLFTGVLVEPNHAGTVLFSIYLIGAILGLIAIRIMSLLITEKFTKSTYIIDIPRYRIPSLKLTLRTTKLKTQMFLKKAGSIILLLAILLWFLGSYPKNHNLINDYNTKIQLAQNSADKTALANELSKKEMKYSYLGKIGEFIQPAFAPLGFDWRLSVALVSGIAAKEVVVASLGVLYSLGDSSNSYKLASRVKENVSIPTILAFLMFIMTYMPCFAASVTFTKEIGGVKYVIWLFLFTTTVAYILAFITYHIAKLSI